tara:strand:- start:192 stop:353 length:162 start_codon:yes stop_codon:yes gene_type:complete
MASTITEKDNKAKESLVKATAIVLDKVNVRAYLDRASMETSKILGGNSIVMLV